ncbi:MAG: response regulator [Desulfobacter sp.]|nr:MAG: response regulator [Desulfobacter sp.]
MENIKGKTVDKTARVLLVDDEDNYRQSLARRLTRRNLAVAQARDGASCLDFLAKEEIDVVVLDMKMPGMSGMETFRAVHESYPDIQVIFLTGDAAIAEGVAGIKAGAFDYLSKPVEIDHLAGKIRQARALRQLEAARERDRQYKRRMENRMIHTQRLASLGTMSTGIAHEINNPLAVINESAGFMRQVLEGQGQIPDKAMLFKGLEKIEKSVDRARRITHQLLGYVRKKGAGLSKVDIRLLAEDTLGLVKQRTEAKKVSVEWDTASPGEMMMHTDPFQLRQVLINLLENAVDAVSFNGQIRLSLSRSGKAVCLAVGDNGSGIEAGHMERIFDPFFTTKSIDNGSDKGTGLGLFVVHRIMENLGGSISVESRPGRRTQFTVCLPEWHPDKEDIKER